MSKFEVFLIVFYLISVSLVIGADLIRQKKSGKLSLESAMETAASVISRVSLSLLTDAEKKFGAGTGELKMSYAVERIIELLPPSVVETVPKSYLQEKLEDALTIAKTKWCENPNYLNK